MSEKRIWTPRERILTAMRRGIPDRVPVIPDISNMVPARLTGKPFWDIYLYEDPPLDVAYLEAVKHFGMDGWYIYDNATMHEDPKWSHRVIDKNEEEIKAERWIDTPFGRLEEAVSYPVSDPPWTGTDDGEEESQRAGRRARPRAGGRGVTGVSGRELRRLDRHRPLACRGMCRYELRHRIGTGAGL